MIDIVICDDEVILRNGLKSWVEKSGLPLKVSGTAGNGPQALELIAKQKPFIALMDVNMPGMAGLDVIERSEPGNRHQVHHHIRPRRISVRQKSLPSGRGGLPVKTH